MGCRGKSLTDNFQEKQLDTFPLRNYDQITFGAFAQNSWKATKWFNLETGFRADYVIDYGIAFYYQEFQHYSKLQINFLHVLAVALAIKRQLFLPKKANAYNIKM